MKTRKWLDRLAGVSLFAAILGLGSLPAAEIVFYVDGVTGGAPNNARDLVLRDRLVNQGHIVTTILDSAGQVGDLSGKDLVLISSSTQSGDIAAFATATLRTADLSLMLCQNGVTLLFGSSSEQWSDTSAKQFVTGVATLWNNWQ